MNLLIRGCNLVSMAETREKYELGVDILISNSKIKKIGKIGKLPKDTEIIDAKGKICLPGFINTHTHLAMSIFRETLDGYTLQDWLEKKIWPMEEKLTEEDIYFASLLSFIEMISTGTVMASDQYFMADKTIEAANKVGARLQTTRTINDVGGIEEKRLNELEDLIKKYHNKYKNIYLNVGIHGLYTTGLETVKKSIALAKKYNLPVHMHFCENQQEVLDIKKAYNIDSPVGVLEKYFGDVNTILAHVVEVSEEEIDRLSKINMNVSHCPISNLRLGCGIAKIQKMVDAGINVSLGTDGQGSGSSLDMFDNMKFAALLQKGEYKNAGNMDSYEVLKMATINGARALGMEERIGTIEEGKEADIIIVDLNTEVCQPVGNVFADIVYNAKGNNVETTIINGEIVMRDRKIKGINKEEIYQKCTKIIERISL